MLALAPAGLVLSALKPAQDGDGLVLRLQNPGDEASEARIELGFPVREAHACRLDEQVDADAGPVALESAGRVLRVSVPARSLCSLRLR